MFYHRLWNPLLTRDLKITTRILPQSSPYQVNTVGYSQEVIHSRLFTVGYSQKVIHDVLTKNMFAFCEIVQFSLVKVNTRVKHQTATYTSQSQWLTKFLHSPVIRKILAHLRNFKRIGVLFTSLRHFHLNRPMRMMNILRSNQNNACLRSPSVSFLEHFELLLVSILWHKGFL